MSDSLAGSTQAQGSRWQAFWHHHPHHHHHAPTRARFGRGESQPDPGGWTIVFLQRCGLVWHVWGEQLKAADRERAR